MKNKIAVSVIVSVKNEELNLSNCLEKLNAFSEVIVVDSNSTDKTPIIVNEFNFKLVNFNWNGKFPKKRNWVLENIPLKNNWVLFLDADEILTPQFIEEVSKKIKDKNNSGYWIFYNNFFMGKEQRFGLKMRKLSLFKKNSGRFEKIDEDMWSKLDMEIHEHPIIKGKVGYIKSTIIHNDFRGLDHFIHKHNQYSTWEAKRYLKNYNFINIKFTFRQNIKYFLIWAGVLPLTYFIVTYFFKLGFLDGKTGYYFARYKANYFFQIQTKIIQLKSKK